MTAENTPNPATPDTIVLIHGLWMTPLSEPKSTPRPARRPELLRSMRTHPSLRRSRDPWQWERSSTGRRMA